MHLRIGGNVVLSKADQTMKIICTWVARATVVAITLCSLVHAQTATDFIRLETETLLPLMDFQNRQTDKQSMLLDRGAEYRGHELLLGTQLRGSALFASTNTADSFPYLGRFPTDFEGTRAGDVRLLQANFDAVGTFHPWITGHVDFLFSDVFSFGDFKQGSIQVRQAYAVVGNTNVTPIYGFVGKKYVSFGDFSTLSPFTQAVPWHYFAGLAEGGGVGYYGNGLHLVATALNGSRGIRLVDSERKGELNNFAVNASYERSTDNGGFRLGAGYLHGTIYDGATAEHLDATVTGPRNGAWDVNATVKYKRFAASGEFVQTLENWPVTGSRVTAYKVEGAYDTNIGKWPGWLSASWSEGLQGQSGEEFEFNRQLVIGAAAEVTSNVLFTMEYVESTGFAPLINITTVSNRDVRQRSVVFGLVVVL